MQQFGTTIIRKPWGTETILFEDLLDQFDTIKSIKVLTTTESLSIQVHPDKNEMWYVSSIDPTTPDSSVLMDLKLGTVIQDMSHPSSIPGHMTSITPSPGDIIKIPQGLLHSLGPGMKVVEVGDSEGTTYRLYDWDRDGRPLHPDQAILFMTKPLDSRPDFPDRFSITPMSISEETQNGEEGLTIEHSDGSELFLVSTESEVNVLGFEQNNIYELTKLSPDHALNIPEHIKRIRIIGNGKILVIKSENMK